MKIYTIKIIVYILIIEAILWIFWLLILKFNYKSLTSSESWISKKIITPNIEIKNINIYNKNVSNNNVNDENTLYNGILWNIDKKINTELLKNKYTNTIVVNYKINDKMVDKMILINFLSENHLLDKYIYSYIYDNNINIKWEFKNIINFALLLNVINSDNWILLSNNFNINYNKQIWKISSNISEHKFKELWEQLDKISHKTIRDKIPEMIYWNSWLIKDKRFKYILNKMYSKNYYKYIKNASKLTGIDEKLIISAISVEQLRFLTTDRGYAKNLIKNNKYLTNFTQFSYWLWWIKLNTFIQINNQLKLNNNHLYQNIFKQYNDEAYKIPKEENLLWKEITGGTDNVNKKKEYDDEKIKKILEDKNTWTLYVGWLIYNILEKRRKAWVSINNKPWVIITLYNMWNIKTPHANPDVWWSLIKIKNWENLYFWEIWLIYFNYIKYYLN